MNTNTFIVSDKQIKLDTKLTPYDLWATKVHVLMLLKQKIIEKSKAKNILKALTEIEDEVKFGKFTIDPDKGLHLTIEAKVIEKIGDDGYFMHTARSRNDQVMTAEMLYLREKVLEILTTLLKLLKLLVEKGEGNITTIMSGYTHMQPAKPTTFGQWYLAYHDMFLKGVDTLRYYYQKYDLCPLGAVESYGTSWNIDRTYTAELLGFTNVWEIPQEAISSRGFPQLVYLEGLKDIAIVISKIASDLLLFTAFEFGYISLTDSVAVQMGSVTGSSIMPQKKNPDVLELLRSLAPQVIGYESIVANILSGLPMGYNRDTREVKEFIELGFSKVEIGLKCLIGVLESIEINTQKMYQNVLDNYSLAPEVADYLSQKTGLPYRKIYKLVGQIVMYKKKEGRSLSLLTKLELVKAAKKLQINMDLSKIDLDEPLNPYKAIEKRSHVGGAASKIMKDMIEVRYKSLKEEQGWIETKWQIITEAKRITKAAVEKSCRPTKY